MAYVKVANLPYLIGNAVLDNFEEDLKLEPGQFNTAIMIFYVSVHRLCVVSEEAIYIDYVCRRAFCCFKFPVTSC